MKMKKSALGRGEFDMDENEYTPISEPSEPSAGSKGEKRRKRSKRSKLLLALQLVFLGVFAVSGYMVLSQVITEKREAAAFDDITALIGEDPPAFSGDGAADTVSPGHVSSTGPMGGSGAEQSELFTDGRYTKYDKVYEQNNDFFGWICIEGTQINYPVMYTPDDPEYYLHRAFDGSRSSSGVPFMDANCYVGCGNYLVYGHHMKNGSMFAGITKFAKKEYWEEHKTIQFDTLDAPGTYEIIAAFYSRVYRVSDTDVFRFYNYTDLTDEDTFNEYMDQVYASAAYDTGVTAEYGDELLTMTTCSYHTTEGRFVIVAKKIS